MMAASMIGSFSLLSIWRIFIQFKDLFLTGLLNTLWMAIVIVILGTVLGAIIALLKQVRFKPLQILLGFYIEFLRGTPVLLQLYIVFYGLPEITGSFIDKEPALIMALVINSSAYVAEIFRAGIQAVDKGQAEAAKSLGLSNLNMMTRIILPQAVKNILPAMGNEFIMMIKETSLGSVLFVGELTTTFRTVQSIRYVTIQPLIIVGIIYFTLTYSLSKLIAYMEKKLGESDV